jgi:hypothetical protein
VDTSTKKEMMNDDSDTRITRQEDKPLLYFVVGVMPFLYGAATRLPFVFYLSVHFELSWWVIGLCVGAYQSGHVIINVTCAKVCERHVQAGPQSQEDATNARVPVCFGDVRSVPLRNK